MGTGRREQDSSPPTESGNGGNDFYRLDLRSTACRTGLMLRAIAAAIKMVHPRGADTAVGDVSSCSRRLRGGERLDVAELS